MSLIDLYREYGIDFRTDGKHVTKGWVGVHCPFCEGSRDYHLGANLRTWAFHCWRCGRHDTVEALSTILRVDKATARSLIRKHKEGGFLPVLKAEAKGKSPFVLPPCRPLSSSRAYLVRRGFDPDRLEREWGLVETGLAAKLDGIDFSYRIIAPFEWNREVVTFQGRDYTGVSKFRYLACPPARERVSIKTILYGKQEKWDGVGICVEGITDVWRLGPLSFACLGISFKTAQLVAIAKHFDRVVVLFDSEPQAQKKARELVDRLTPCGVKAVVETIPCGDPADLNQEDADYLVRQLTKRIIA